MPSGDGLKDVTAITKITIGLSKSILNPLATVIGSSVPKTGTRLYNSLIWQVSLSKGLSKLGTGQTLMTLFGQPTLIPESLAG